MKKLLIFLSLVFSVHLAMAQSNSNGLVMTPIAISGGVIAFMPAPGSAFAGVKPACSTWAWAVDVKNPGGRAIYAMVLQAFALGKNLTVIGTGVCDVWGNSETVSWVYISN
jgi:hypothetical protein